MVKLISFTHHKIKCFVAEIHWEEMLSWYKDGDQSVPLSGPQRCGGESFTVYLLWRRSSAVAGPDTLASESNCPTSELSSAPSPTPTHTHDKR